MQENIPDKIVELYNEARAKLIDDFLIDEVLDITRQDGKGGIKPKAVFPQRGDIRSFYLSIDSINRVYLSYTITTSGKGQAFNCQYSKKGHFVGKYDQLKIAYAPEEEVSKTVSLGQRAINLYELPKWIKAIDPHVVHTGKGPMVQLRGDITIPQYIQLAIILRKANI